MITPARPDDLPSLARLMAESALLQRYHTTYADALSLLTAALGAGDLVLCYRSSRAAVPEGLAWVSFAPRMLNGAAYLRLLLVARPKNGIGTLLLSAAEETARASANHLYLLATTDNVDARRFYARRGYRHVGDLAGLVMPDLAEALYHKPLRTYTERLSS